MNEQASDGRDEDLENLLAFVRDTRGFDLTGYKRTSLARRIRKRMNTVDAQTYTDYRDMLEASAQEFEELFNTILINVTGFFRDPDAWTCLQQDMLPEILTQAGPDEEIRVWSAGCSSGEEAYSLAIVFAEALGVEEYLNRVKIYGTDVDEEALREARAGVYPARALDPVPEDLRDKYFEQTNARYAFRSDLRRRVIFGRHDLSRDAPISRLDLLVCRNTLMYFNVESQSRVIDRFHFALRDGGFLFLGKAEMLLSDGERFEVTTMRQRIFRRRPGNTPRPPHLTIPLQSAYVDGARGVTRRRALREQAFATATNAMIAVDADEVVDFINGQAKAQFGLSSHDVGRPFRDLEISYRPVELRSVIELALAERRMVRLNAVEGRMSAEESRYLDIVVQPLWGEDGHTLGVSITFVDVTAMTRLQQEVKRHREDLETAYEELQSTNEELETTNEELQSSIEELETTNEELQSTNEELETTNEELESGNEELETMNDELRTRGTELGEARGFLEGVLASIAAGVVVLDGELRVRSWNRGAQDLWGLRPDEVGREPFFDLDFGLPTERLRAPLQDCLTTGTKSKPVRLEAINRLGRAITCTVICSPLDGGGGGVVLLMEQE